MNAKKIYTKVTLKCLDKSISDSYYGILLVVLLNVLTGVLIALIEDATKTTTLFPLGLYFLPAIFYYFVAKNTRLNTMRYEIYLFVGVFYISVCLIEFNRGYSLDKPMMVYWDNGNKAHPMSYVIQLIPLVYKSFKLGLSLIFFRIAYLVYKYHKLTMNIK
ncbi:membrane protein of unknown function [Tenacibaculum sp. 190130A14a]|uniref:Uncharacterized protein n=1 Tax=Tenacibaculum polynesiense TaxID=3137857 RepID=A0ABM9PCH4_9FLAO